MSHHMSLGNFKLRQEWDTTAPIGMAKIQNTDNIKCWQRCGAIGTLIAGGMNMVQSLWKTVGNFLKT